MKKFALAAVVAVGLMTTAHYAFAGYYVPTCDWVVLGYYGPVLVCG